MTDAVRAAVGKAVEELIEATTSAPAIRKSFETHRGKVRREVLGGLLQSNIKFGNFIEKLLDLAYPLDAHTH